MAEEQPRQVQSNLPPNIPVAQIPDNPPDEETLCSWFLSAGLGPTPEYYTRDWSKKKET